MSKRGFSKLDPQSHVGKTTTWLTPLDFIEQLGTFDLDPCAHKKHKTAKNLIALPKDGLKEKWGGRVWLNPPYGRGMDKWIQKLSDHGNGIALLFARTDTKLFHTVKPDLVFFLKGRIAFLDENFQSDTNAGHGSMLLAWGQKNVNAIFKSGIPGKGFKERRK